MPQTHFSIKVAFISLLFSVAAPLHAQSPKGEADLSHFPSFSWNTVPRYMHVRKVTAFTPEEIEYLAQFPLLTFEKTTGAEQFGSTEQGTQIAAKAVKKLNPSSKILYYRNIFVHYGSYHANEFLSKIESPFLLNQQGNTRLIRSRVPAYDLSNTNLQAWWLENAKDVCASPHIDGIFIDGNIKALEKSYLLRQLGAEKKNATIAGYHQVMEELPKVLGPDKLILSNIIRARLADSGLECLNYFDGSYIEGFEHETKGIARKDYLAKGIAAIQQAAQAGKIIAFTMSIEAFQDTDMDAPSRRKNRSWKKVPFQKRLTYSLALFLVCAEKYSYFMLHDGYSADPGSSQLWMKAIPEYERPLGPPIGPAIKQGYLYQRSFEHAEVSVNIEEETASINWK